MADETVYCFFVLPWLRLTSQLNFGSVTVAPVTEAVATDDPRLETVHAILAMFRGLGGGQLVPALMWPTGDHPLELDDRGLTSVFAHRDWLSTAALMGNQYCVPLDAPFTDANADGYAQRFTIGTQHVTLTKRRRDGQSRDGWPIDRIVTQMPLSASPTHQLVVDQALVDSFAALPFRTDALGLQIEAALPLFTQANRLSERTPLAFDLVLLAAALERLYDIHSPVAQGLADALGAAFSSYTQGTTTWQNRSMSGNLTADQGPWIKRWVREFYAHRSAIHGGATPHSSDWDDLYHALIATEVFTLSVKVLFEQDGTRPMTVEERLSADSLDDRIERLAASGADLESVWRDARSDAQHRASVKTAIVELHRLSGLSD